VGIDLPVEAEPHLRAVLERQPVVLTRVGKDGTFLAVNEAGLSMLGAQSLEQVLGTSLMNMVQGEDRKACQAFIDRAMGGQRGSFEVDLVGLTGSRHTLELHASAHPGAPDAVPSVLVSLRDVTESRRLEHSLVESATRQAEQEAAHDAERKRLLADLELARKAQSDQFAADEQLTELERRLAESNDERAALQKTFAEEIARLQEALAEQRRQADLQLAAVARLDGNDQQLAELRSRYDAIDSERQQLLDMAGLLRSEAEARQQTVTELTERLEALEGERQHAVDTANALRLDLDERHNLVADLTTRLQLVESDQQQTSESSSQLQRELESRTALANELAARIETLESEQVSLRAAADAELTALRSTTEAEQAATRAQAESERAQLHSQVEAEKNAMRAALEQEQASIRSEIEAKLQEAETRYGTDTGALRDALNGSLTEQARLAEAMAAAEEDAAQKGSQIAALELAMSEERKAHAGRLVDLEANAATRLAELELRSADADRAYEARVSELQAANAAFQAERESADAAAAARTAERDAIHAKQIAELESAHAARLSELEAAVAQATERADDALAAVQRAEDAFGAERQRLEDALLAAVDGERAAKHALSTEIASRTVAERGQRQMQQAIERFAKEAGVTINITGGAVAAPPPAAKVTTTTKALADRLNNALPRRLGDGLSMQLLASSGDVSVAVDAAAVINAVGVFADSRRMSMLSGQVTVEIAQVTIDEAVGRARGMTPGAYALVAMNIEGPGAQQGFPQELFDSVDPRAWRAVKEDLQAARTAVLGAGGQVWLTREGASIMIVEFYLPREGAR
jgi:PAS domain S-box-containing protein